MSATRGRPCDLRTRLGLICAVALLSQACAGPRPLALPGRERNPRELPGSTDRAVARAQETDLDAKVVAGKEPPATLISEDGFRCAVTELRYREAQIGERTVCAWRRGARAQ
jgi:hypothetical protein